MAYYSLLHRKVYFYSYILFIYLITDCGVRVLQVVQANSCLDRTTFMLRPSPWGTPANGHLSATATWPLQFETDPKEVATLSTCHRIQDSWKADCHRTPKSAFRSEEATKAKDSRLIHFTIIRNEKTPRTARSPATEPADNNGLDDVLWQWISKRVLICSHSF